MVCKQLHPFYHLKNATSFSVNSFKEKKTIKVSVYNVENWT